MEKNLHNFVDIFLLIKDIIKTVNKGFKVVTTTFSPFQTLRCAEQIKVNLGYMKHKICLNQLR